MQGDVERYVVAVGLIVVESGDLDLAAKTALAELWNRAFGDRFTQDDADHAFGGVHVLMQDDGRLVGHESAVGRRLRFGDGPWCAVGHVEAVATDPDR